MRGFVAGLALWLVAASAAHAQGSVQQSGPIVPFHPTVWGSNGVVMDGGTPAAPVISSLGLFGGSNCPFGVSSQAGPGVSSAPHSEVTICQTDATTTFTFAGVNGETDPAVIFNIGGIDYGFPGPGNGDVLGPPSATNGDLACFNTTTGKLLEDCGAKLAVPVPIADGGTNATTASGALNNLAGLPHVANNTALSALAHTAYAAIVRDGFATAGDAPPLAYTPSASPCSLNAGAGDGGYQVPTSDSGCWVASFPNGQVDFREYGADSTGVADAASALTKVFALPIAATLALPPGTFRLTCGNYFSATSALSISGTGTLKYDSGCTFTSDNLAWHEKSGVRLQNFTLDLNTPAVAGALHNAIVAYAYTASADTFTVDHVNVLNGTSPLFEVAVGAQASHTYANVRITNNYVTLAAAATTQNQCIALTTVNGAGFIPNAQVNHNVCVNSAIQTDGVGTQIIGNDVSGYKFGAGVFTAFDTGVVTTSTISSKNCVIIGNVFHDTVAGLDVNNSAAGGLENNCYGALVQGNVAYNLGGAGFLNYASNTTYVGNLAYNNGKEGNAGAAGVLTQAGFALNNNASGNAVYTSQAVTMKSNVAFDSQGSPTQIYGFKEEPGGNTFTTNLSGNNFTGSSGGYGFADVPSPNMGIGTDVVQWDLTNGGQAAITFTNIDTTSFKRWVLNCRDVSPFTADKIMVQVGEGSTPTWETGAHYTVTENINDSSTLAVYHATGLTGIQLSNDNWDHTQSSPGGFTLEFGDLAYALGWKMAYRIAAGFRREADGNFENVTGTGAWVNDINAITALRVLTVGGANVFGSCTLTGYAE